MLARRLGSAGVVVCTLSVLALTSTLRTGASSRRATANAVRAAPRACSTASVLSHWSTPRLVAQTIVVPIDQSDLNAARSSIRLGVGGLILFGDVSPRGLGKQLVALSNAAPGHIFPLVMADEEGGAVQRLVGVVGDLASPRQMGATMTTAAIKRLATSVARKMRAAGVNTDLAPVLDVDGGNGPNARDPDGTRSFSPKVAVASADGVAFLKGLEHGGVLAVAKHFPGLGGASANTDLAPAVTPPWPVEQRRGLPPFEAAIKAGVRAIMVSNAVVPGLSKVPASISPEVIRVELRERLGFHGLVIPDSLSAAALKAIGLNVANAAIDGLRAGEDMVLFNASAHGLRATVQRLIDTVSSAVGTPRLTRARLVEAVLQVLETKGVRLCRAAR